MMRVMIAVLMIVMTTILHYVPEQEASHDTGRVSEVELEQGQYSLPIDSGSTPPLLLITEIITKNVSNKKKYIYHNNNNLPGCKRCGRSALSSQTKCPWKHYDR